MYYCQDQNGHLSIAADKMRKRFYTTISLTIVLAVLLPGPFALAVFGDRTIDPSTKFAWGENVGWINFGTPEGNVHIMDTEMTGFAWGENVGWISLNCSNTGTCGTVSYKVSHNGTGTLSGFAWGENTGWLSFSPTFGGVTIDLGTGFFSGSAWGENVGWIVFSCETTGSCATVNYRVGLNGGAGGGGSVIFSTPTPTPGGGGGPGASPTPSGSPGPSISPFVTPVGTPAVSPLPTPVRTPPIFGTPAISPFVSPPVQSPPPPGQIVPPGPPGGGPGGVGGGGIGQIINLVTGLLFNTEPIPIPPWLRQLALGIMRFVPGKESAFVAIASLGVFTTAASGLTTVLAWFGTLLDIFDYLSYVYYSLLELFAIRRRSEPWGTVYDSSTKKPISFAKVQLLDRNLRVLETKVADLNGRYGFLLAPKSSISGEPASIEIQLQATKNGYIFPSQSVLPPRDTVLYDNVYTGGIREVRGEAVANFDIPLDPIKAAVAKPVSPPALKLRIAAIRASDWLFWLTLITLPIQYLAMPHLLNLIILVMFLLLAFFRIFGLRARPFGFVQDTRILKTLPFSLITLNDLAGRRVGFTVSDEEGRYFLLSQKGSYNIYAYTPATETPVRESAAPVYTRRGWITKKLAV